MLGQSTGRSISWITAQTQATLRMSLMMMMKMMALVPPRRKRMMIQQQVRAFASEYLHDILFNEMVPTVCIK